MEKGTAFRRDIVRSAIGNMFGYSKEERMKMSKLIVYSQIY